MTLVLADRVDLIQGKLQDLRQGIIPNPWAERGWGAEWKYNRPAFIRNVATTALLITAATMLMVKKKKRKQLLGRG